MHYNHNSEGVSKDLGDGWRENIIELAEGDTADAPGTTKKVLVGPGKVTYRIHPSSVSVVSMDDSVTLRARAK